MFKNLFGYSRGEKSQPASRLTAAADGIFQELQSVISSSGRVPFLYLSDVARAMDPEGFATYVRGPALVGSAIQSGNLEQPTISASRDPRQRAKTLLFRREEMLQQLAGSSEVEPLQKAIYPLTRAPVTAESHLFSIGREPSNDLVIPEFSISRKHAEIRVVGKRYEIVDLRSSNGTFVNGARVEDIPVVLGFGDVVAFARYEFTFSHPESLRQSLLRK